MERDPFELRHAGDVRQTGTVELPHPHDEHVERLRAARRRDLPLRAVENGPPHLRVEADLFPDVVFVGAMFEIFENFGLFRVAAGPARILLEGVRVQMRGNVAPRPGIAVVPPGAAEIAGLLEDRVRANPCPFELDRHAQPAETRSDDRDAWCHAALRTQVRIHLHYAEPRSEDTPRRARREALRGPVVCAGGCCDVD
jgi:hypothetical protein